MPSIRNCFLSIIRLFSFKYNCSLNTSLSKSFKSIGTGFSSISFPYTATQDGFVIMRLRGSNAAQIAYWYATINSIEVGSLVSTSGAHVTCCVPIAKGEKIQTLQSGNAVTAAYFKPLNT